LLDSDPPDGDSGFWPPVLGSLPFVLGLSDDVGFGVDFDSLMA
jgi:hypothetical protein